MNFYDYPVAVPFGNPDYDVELGGSHNLTFAAPPNTPVLCLVHGTVLETSSPTWGRQITIAMDHPVNGHGFFSYQHLAAIQPSLTVGERVSPGQLLGWSGGCTDVHQYDKTLNPTGVNFLDSEFMSSQPQVGIALCDGAYGRGAGWKIFPPIDKTLDPMPVVEEYKKSIQPVLPDDQRRSFEAEYRAVLPHASLDTGIALWAWEEYKAGRNRGPALTGEYGFWQKGEEFSCQLFVSGRVIWSHKDHSATWQTL